MSRFTLYRHCGNFGKNFQTGEVSTYFNAGFAPFYRNHFLYAKLKFFTCKAFILNWFSPYCHCADFGNIQPNEVLANFGTIFAITTDKANNNPINNLIIKYVERERERERERDCAIYF
jgi:hypothetical protein